MNPAQLIILLAGLGQAAIAAAAQLKNQHGIADEALRAQIAADDQATRDSIDKFLASLPPA